MKQKVASLKTSLIKHFRIWLFLAKVHIIQRIINSRLSTFVFVIGKLIRFFFHLIFIVVLLRQTNALVGYTLNQAIFILLTLHLIGTLVSVFLRGIYIFRQRVIQGTFDFLLLFPANTLFMTLFSDLDPMDLIVIGPYAISVIWFWGYAGFPVTVGAVLAYILFLLISLIVALAWHTVIAAFGIIFLELDNLIMIYRDIESMARFPLEIYGKGIQFFLTYFMPIAVMAALPSQVAFTLISPWSALFFLALAIIQFLLALRFWHFALTKYSSASS